jgi:hypothetical protein
MNAAAASCKASVSSCCCPSAKGSVYFDVAGFGSTYYIALSRWQPAAPSHARRPPLRCLEPASLLHVEADQQILSEPRAQSPRGQHVFVPSFDYPSSPRRPVSSTRVLPRPAAVQQRPLRLHLDTPSTCPAPAANPFNVTAQHPARHSSSLPPTSSGSSTAFLASGVRRVDLVHVMHKISGSFFFLK